MATPKYSLPWPLNLASTLVDPLVLPVVVRDAVVVARVVVCADAVVTGFPLPPGRHWEYPSNVSENRSGIPLEGN